MPRKTKDQNELDSNKIEVDTSKIKEQTIKKKTTKKSDTEKKKAATKKTTTKSTKPAKETDKKAKTVEKEASANTTKKATKKTTNAKAETKKNTTKPAQKNTTTKRTRKKVEKVQIVEYYDLPYRYNQTIVKVLAQTPTNLFIYWDISDQDRENYKKQYGENFFESTKPILKIYNDTLGYNFEVEINDFANSWYLQVNDSKCDYRIELGRRPIYRNDYQQDYFYVSTSNKIESPNDKILFNNEQKMVYFKNIKTNETLSKEISNLTFIRNMGKIYNISDFYKTIYKEEKIEEIYDMLNPSSKI